MNTSKLTTIICSIVGADKVNRAQRAQIKALLDTMVSAGNEPVMAQKGSHEKQTVVEEPNTLKDDANTISLQDAPYFRLPHDINLEIEGESEPRKIKILPDGITEAQTYGNTN